MLRILNNQADRFRSQGAVIETWRYHRGVRLGPYYRLAFRGEGRQRSIYLGTDPELADEVRRWLKAQQANRREELQRRRWLKSLRSRLRKCKEEWARELRKVGLYLKGSEVRGWRGRQSRDLE